MQTIGYLWRAAWCAALLTPLCCLAETKPLWELGVGPGAVQFSDYPGSSAYRTYAIPVPYVRYRGKFLRSDRNGVRGVVLEAPRLSLNVSLGATVPAHSRDDSAREGMPNLNALLEIGPSLDLHMWRSDMHDMQLDLRLPIRLALTATYPPRNVGWIAAPHINLDIRNVGGSPGWDLGLLAGPLYATQPYNRYFYAVLPAYATAQRPIYDPPAGYAGAEFTIALSRRFPTFWVGTFVRYQTLGGAVYVNSPLIRSHSDLAAGVGIAWIVSRSDRRVEASE
jgi:outer membrane protein